MTRSFRPLARNTPSNVVNPTNAITFDDINLLPRYSEIETRSGLDTHSFVSKNIDLEIPIIAAPMDTVCGYDMAYEIAMNGGIGIIHRFMTIDDQAAIINKLRQVLEYNNKKVLEYKNRISSHCTTHLAAAIGANGDCLERAEQLLIAGANLILIDVAHGHHVNVQRTIGELTNRFKHKFEFDIMAGNVATDQGAYDLEQWGADSIRVGIGGGSVCETRIRTGVGVPQLTAIQLAKHGTTLPIVSDGGIRTAGDIAKALAFGASSVMLGSLLAGTNESPGEIFLEGHGTTQKKYKMFRGSASAAIKIEKTGQAKHVEGASTLIPVKGPVKDVLSDLMDGVKSSMSYLGASSIKELQQNCEFVAVSSAGLREAHPHLITR